MRTASMSHGATWEGVTKLMLSHPRASLPHYSGDLIRRGGALSAVADGGVLTENAPQVASAQEDGAGAAPAHQRRLLAVMWTGAGNQGQLPHPAEPRFARRSVHAAIARAHAAGAGEAVGPPDRILGRE